MPLSSPQARPPQTIVFGAAALKRVPGNVGGSWDDAPVERDRIRVPVRTKELLESWVNEFLKENITDSVQIRVAVQDGSDGRDTGLVTVYLGNANAEVYMQPAAFDGTEWEATLTARPADVTLSPYKLAALAAEVALASSLCTFLQFKSLEWDRMSGMHNR